MNIAGINFMKEWIGGPVKKWVGRLYHERGVRTKRRASLIDAVRDFGRKGMSSDEFIKTPEYSTLRPNLNDKLVKRIESKGVRIVDSTARGSGTNNFWPEIYDELSRLEKEWELL